MELRIVDKKLDENDDNNEDVIDIIFEKDGEYDCFTIDVFDSPFSVNFQKSLRWYFNEYPRDNSESVGDKGIGEKLLKFGQYLGDYLLGEDHELNRFVQKIEKEGYENLRVSVESKRLDFFDELWETLILPESKFVLSSACKQFVRRLNSSNGNREYPELEFELGVASPVANALVDMEPNSVDTGNNDTGNNKAAQDIPLRALHILFRVKTQDFDGPSNAFNTSTDLLSTEGAIEYHILPVNNWNGLLRQLVDIGDNIHILHLDGPLFFEGGRIWFGSKDSQISIASLLDRMQESKIPLLSLDVLACRNVSDHNIGEKQLSEPNQNIADKNEAFSVRYGLARVAELADDYGIGNVLGLGERVDPWLSSECFKMLYHFLALGFNLGQAVVESRKALQKQSEISRFRTQTKPFNTGTLFTHYGGQPLRFFSNSQTITDLNESHRFRSVSQKLLGFKSQLLQPSLRNTADGQLLDLLKQWQNGERLLAVEANAGLGKTCIAHRLCFYLAQNNCVDYGFYFDFNKNFYSSDTMLQMIAPVFEKNPEEKEETEQTLNRHKCCFVLDNFHNAEFYKFVP